VDHQERADEVEKEIERLEHESKRLGQRTNEVRNEWESAKSEPTKAPGAQGPDSTGPHHIDDPDPATGRKYGEVRKEELEDARAADAEDEGG
jgi:hypothetical protein